MYLDKRACLTHFDIAVLSFLDLPWYTCKWRASVYPWYGSIKLGMRLIMWRGLS